MENRKRNKQIIIRLTEKELSEFSEKMKRAKSKSRSDFIMALVRNSQIIVPDGLPEITAELKRQGNNLNQLTRFYNQTKNYPSQLNFTLKNCNETYEIVSDFICKLKRRE